MSRWVSSDVDSEFPAPVIDDSCQVPDGIGEHRRAVRRRGPVVALVLPVLMAIGAFAFALVGPDTWWSATAVLGLALAAGPGLAIAGLPVTSGLTSWGVAVVISATWWVMVGTLAARRATAVPGASWPEWWRHYRSLAAGTMIGSWAALGAFALVMVIRSTN